jgi:hypothetical protein
VNENHYHVIPRNGENDLKTGEAGTAAARNGYSKVVASAASSLDEVGGHETVRPRAAVGGARGRV